MGSEPHLVSFVVRFVVEERPDNPNRPAAGWHGLIRHVQSDAERHFARWEEAVAFMAQYIHVDRDRHE